MAIQFLNNLNLNDNQLLNAKVQVASTAPTAAKGQIYLDSTTDVNTFKYHDGSQWIGLKQLNLNNSTFINLTNLSAAGSNVISLQASLNATGEPTVTKYLRGDNTWSPITGIYNWKLGDAGTTTAEIVNNDVVKFLGTAGEIETALSGKNITIGLPAAVSIATSLTVVGNGQNSFGGQVTIPATPVAATDAASKGYVDAAVAGGLIYQGGYNAATNTPNLDTPPTGTIKKGFMWTVTADGLFFTEQLRVGDSVIAEVDSPTTLADWTTVQGNVDLATLTTVGIGNVNAGDGVGVAYLSGTATVTNTDKGSSQNIFKNIVVSGQSTVVAETNDDTLTLVAGNAIAITTNAAADAITIASTYTPPVTSTAIPVNTSGTYNYPASITASNINNVMIQLVDTVTHETVYADVTRISTGSFAVSYATPPTNGVTALIQLIG